MTDLLAHVLLGYVLGTVARWTCERVERRHVPLAMAGATVPDVAKVGLVVDFAALEPLVGVAPSPLAWHTIGGAVVLAAAATVPFRPRERLPVGGTLVAGLTSHLLVDLLVIRASTRAPPYLYPLTWWRPPSGMVLLSSRHWPTVLAVVLAAGVFLLDRRYRDPNSLWRSSRR